MTRKRILWTIAASIAGVLLIAIVALILVVRSPWFYGKVRAYLIDTIETATGGRAEIRAFHFDWEHMRAEVTGLTLHGTEPAGSPPLFQADSLVVGLKVISLLKRDVDIQYLEINAPHIYLIVDADGRTNVPEPKIPSKQRSNSPVETLLKAAIGRFTIQNGTFEVASRGKTPFEARGRNLKANLLYDITGPRYTADIAAEPIDLRLASYTPLPVGLALAATIERNRAVIRSAHITTGHSRIDVSGAIDDFNSPHGSFQYNARVAVTEATKILRIPELHNGTVQVAGPVVWKGGPDVSITGKLHGYGIDYTDSTIRLRGFRAEAALAAGVKGVDLYKLQISGDYVTDLERERVDGRIANAALRGRDLGLHSVDLAVAGGSFNGEAQVRNLEHYSINGEIAGMAARRVVALYDKAHLPWDAAASGQVHVDGSFKRPRELRASANLSLVPAPGSAPVHGQIDAAYQADGRILDLGRSTVTLPSSRVDFSGSIPALPAHPMRVHLETRNLDDLLPAIGSSAADLPGSLTGSLIFDGTIAGDLDQPHIAGHASITGVVYAGETFDSVEADAEVSPEGVQLSNAAATQGPMRAQFQISLGLHDWKAADSDPLSGSGNVRNAPLADLAQLLDLSDLPITGTVAGSAQLTGTVGDPKVGADLTLTQGTAANEPFDRLTAHLDYTPTTVDLTAGQVRAGGKQASFNATYRHARDTYRTGRLHAQASTNAMQLDQIQTLQPQISGAKGTVQATGTADFDVAPGAKGGVEYSIASLNADLAGQGLNWNAQSIGDAHLTASSQGGLLRAHVESNMANCQVRGDGEWRLEGDYPGSATITFSKLDLNQLRPWFGSAGDRSPDSFTASAEGQIRIDGPLRRVETLKAELTVPQFEIAPTAANALPGGAGVLKNSGPIVVTMANSVITVQSARLTGRATDLTVAGRVQIRDQNVFDLRVNGRLDLAILHEVNTDFSAAGFLTTNATVRGPLDSPQLNGRVEFQNASFNIADFPNGISKASGVLVFTKERATIQKFEGETGGGKIELTGFAGYGGGPLVFRLHALAKEVRVRYPEGVSTVANAALNFTGSSDRSMVSGSVTIVRTAFNPQSDFSSLLAKSAQPVQTPSARTGLLGNLNFDVQINTAPDVQIQSALTHDIQMDANLRVRGSFSNPSVLGRINITQGQVSFFGTNYNLTQGSVAFYNPVKIDPILDIDLATRARGIDITLNISGPFDKPTLTPRSDPPLQFNEIVALLATGQSPTSDPTLLSQQSTAPQSWQQMGASALLGQAIASPVAGRLQRLFGVSQLRIDPTLPGVEINPQARVTVEQQVTPEITFTYITNVTTSNPQVVRVEWAFAKQWSVVALREENGLFGLDFYLKRRF